MRIFNHDERTSGCTFVKGGLNRLALVASNRFKRKRPLENLRGTAIGVTVAGWLTCGISIAVGQPVSWDGDAGDNQWSTAENWSGTPAMVPGATNQVTVDIPGEDLLIHYANNLTSEIESLSIAEMFSLESGSLSVLSGTAIFGNTVAQSGGTLDIAGSAEIEGDLTHTGGSLSVGGVLNFRGNTFTLNGGTINAPVDGVSFAEKTAANPAQLNLMSGNVNDTISLVHTTLNIAPGYAGTVDIVAFGVGNKIESNLGSGQEITLRGTDADTEFGFSILRPQSTMTSSGVITLESTSTGGVSIPGALLDTDIHDFTNQAGGTIHATATNGAPQEITGTGTFTNDGTINVDSNSSLRILGKQDGNNANGRETIQVNLNGGQINGQVSFVDANINIALGMSGAADLQMLGFNNTIEGGLASTHTLSLVGTTGFGFSVLKLTQDMGFDATMNMTSQAVVPVGNTPGTQLDLDNHTFTNSFSGVINVNEGTGGVREIVGTGTFVNDGTINVEPNTVLSFAGVTDGGMTVPLNVELNNGAITGDLSFVHTRVKASSNVSGAADLQMLGFNNTIEGGLASTHTLSLVGTTGFGFSVLKLTQDMGFDATMNMTSQAVVPVGNTPGTQLDLDNHTFTNSFSGVINVNEGTGGVREIVGTGTFVNDGTINVEPNTVLSFAGVTDGGMTVPLNVELNNGAITGDLSFVHTRVKASSNVSGAADLQMLGFNNTIEGGLASTHTLSLVGTTGFGFSVLKLTQDMGFDATMNMTSQAVVPVGNTPGTQLDLDNHTFTNSFSGVINVNEGTGGVREIVGTGTFVNDGTINVEPNTVLSFAGVTDGGMTVPLNVELNNGAITGDLSFVHTRVKASSNVSGAADLQMLGFNNTIEGGLASTHTLSLVGTTGFGFSVLKLTQDMGFDATMNMTSQAVVPVGNTPGTQLDLDNHTFTNSFSGVINVNEGTGGVREIVGTGTFVNDGTINVEPNTVLSFAGVTDGGMTVPLNVELNNGAITGDLSFVHTRVKASSNVSGAADLQMLGFNNTIEGGLASTHTLSLVGTTGFGFSVLKLTQDMGFDATMNMTSQAVVPVGNTPGTQLDLDNHTFTNSFSGVINVNEGTGGVREIVGTGTFVNDGTIDVEGGASLRFSGITIDHPDPTPDEFVRLNVDFNSGSTVNGDVSFTHAAITFGGGFNSPVNFETLGFNNSFSGDLVSGQTVTIRGANDTGFSILNLASSNSTLTGTLVLDSTADVADPTSNNFAGAQLNIDANALTNLTGGVIEVKQGNGVREIIGVGTFSNDGGQINVESDTSLRFSGVIIENVDPIPDEIIPLNVNLNSGSLTGDGEVSFTHTRIVLGSGFTGPGNLQMLGFNNRITGDLASGLTMTLRGTNETGGSVVSLEGNSTSNGRMVLDSDAMAMNGGLPSGAQLDIDTHMFTNAANGVDDFFEVKEGTGGVREIVGTGTFVNEGIIHVEPNTVLSVMGKQDDDMNNGFEKIQVDLRGGEISGMISFSHANINLDPGFTGPADLEMLGFNNTLSGNPSAGQILTLRGTNESGFSVLTLQSDVTSEGTIVFDSTASDGTPLPGSQLDLGFNRFTNAAGGVLRVDTANGAVQEIVGNAGLFTNEGEINVPEGVVLDVMGKQDGNQLNGFEVINVAMNGGSINGVVRFTHSRVTLGSGFTGPAKLEMVGFNHTLTGDLGSDQQLTLLGQDLEISASAGVALQGDMVSEGMIILDSVATASEDGSIPGATLSIGDHTLTNAAGGVIEARRGTGGGREILASDGDAAGELINHGMLIGLTRSELILGISAATSGSGTFSGNVEYGDGLSLESGAQVNLSLGGLVALEEYDQVNITGDVSLTGGQLNVTVEDDITPNFEPEYGDRFEVLTYTGEKTGVFDKITGLTLTPNLALKPEYEEDTQLLSLTAWLPGDANMDGLVDLIDLSRLALNWRQTDRDWSTADFNGDRVVDLQDLSLLGLNWRSSIPLSTAFSLSLASAAAVPEPGSLLLFGSGIFFVFRRRPRNDH